MSYLDVAGFRTASAMPGADIDYLETNYPTFLTEQLELNSAYIDGRLRKRYDAPFALPYPLIVKRWLAKLTVPDAYFKRGYDANDRQSEIAEEERKEARGEILEAANAVDGLWDLPLRADTTATGISKGAPLGYSEASPYVWTDEERDRGAEEDAAGSGTHG